MVRMLLFLFILSELTQADSLRAECDHSKDWVKHTFTTKRLVPKQVTINGVQVNPSALDSFTVVLPNGNTSVTTKIEGTQVLESEVVTDGKTISGFELWNLLGTISIQFER